MPNTTNRPQAPHQHGGFTPQPGQQVNFTSNVAGARGPQGAQRPAPVPNQHPSAKPPKQGGGKRNVLIVLGLIVAVLAIWVVVWLFACNGNSLFDSTAQTGQAPYKSADEIQAELDRVVEEGMFNISIASVIQFPDGQSAGTAYIENVPGNRYNMQVTITQDDTGDVLYESGVLQPNQFIEDITLAKDLDMGVYDATATFKAIDPVTYDEVGQAAAKVTINVIE